MSRSVELFPSASWIIFLRVERDTWQDEEDPLFWTDQRDDMLTVLQHHYPDVQSSDRWLGRETQALGENEHGIFTVAEYGGVIALSFVPDLNLDDFGLALAERFAGEAHDRLFGCDEFAPRLLSLDGFMSNGEAVFRAITGAFNLSAGLAS